MEGRGKSANQRLSSQLCRISFVGTRTPCCEAGAQSTYRVGQEAACSLQDRLEKEEWRAKRKQGREDAIERMKMKAEPVQVVPC